MHKGQKPAKHFRNVRTKGGIKRKLINPFILKRRSFSSVDDDLNKLSFYELANKYKSPHYTVLPNKMAYVPADVYRGGVCIMRGEQTISLKKAHKLDVLVRE